MNTAAARRARLLRVRVIEHRMAALRLVAASAAHAAVADVCGRVAQMRAGIVISQGNWCGHDLQSLSELAERLDHAHTSLQPSLAQARQLCDDNRARRIAAHVAEQRTSRVHAMALRREAVAHELRSASAQPPRSCKPGIGS